MNKKSVLLNFTRIVVLSVIIAAAFLVGIQKGKESVVQRISQESPLDTSVNYSENRHQDILSSNGSIDSENECIACAESQEIPEGEYIEFKDLVKAIAVPEREKSSNPSTLLFAYPGTKVHWETPRFDGKEDWWLTDYFFEINARGAHPNFGKRTGKVNVRIDGKFTSNKLDRIMKDVPWTIGLEGAVHWGKTYAVYFIEENDNNVIVNEYIPEYLQKLGWAKEIRLVDSLYNECHTCWYEINIPGYKKMWMHNGNFGGNAPTTEYYTFVFEDITNFDMCKLIEKWDEKMRNQSVK